MDVVRGKNGRYLNRLDRYPSVALINKTNILTNHPIL
jgi:hypothetical protein